MAMMLDEALAYIHKVDWRGSVPGLSRIDTLLGMLGHPERHVKYIHVTGTNGKGSTCAMLASVLRAAGYKTGLYTSPYIFRFNERMQINGAPIPDDTLCALVEELRPLADRMADPPTEFELVTAIGLTWFAREACDIVVCEVGMGGEFDATNVIPAPEVAVLTNIGLDHTKVLGNTVETIAQQIQGAAADGCAIGRRVRQHSGHTLPDGAAGRYRLAISPQEGRQLSGVQRTGIVGGYSDKPRGQRSQLVVHFSIVLVRQHTGQHRYRLARQILPDGRRQRDHALGVVPSVQNDRGLPPHHLKPSRPRGLGQALTDGTFINVPATLPQNINGRQRNGGVSQLVAAQQGQPQALIWAVVEYLPLQRVAD